MAAKVEDLLIEQGATFKKTITVKDALGVAFDLTGFIARGQIRIGATSPTVIADFTFTFVEPRTTGQIIMELPATVTELMPTTGEKYSSLTKYQYDVEIESSGGVVYRLLNGGANVSPEQTK